MKVWMIASSCVPISRLIDSIVVRLEQTRITKPSTMVIEGEKNLPPHKLSELARKLTSGLCTLSVPSGKIQVSWFYSPESTFQDITGELRISHDEIQDLISLWIDLCGMVDACYSCGDLYDVMTSDSDGSSRTRTLFECFYALYWFNYFGKQYRKEVPLDDSISRLFHSVQETSSGALVVQSRWNPEDRIDEERLRSVIRRWPIFRKYDRGAHFSGEYEFDFSKVRTQEWPEQEVPRGSSIVGDVDEFIRSAASHARRFEEWAGRRGFSANTDGEFIEFIWRNADDIEAEDLVVPAIASFGEFLRCQGSGEWSKSSLVGPVEPIIARSLMPWLNRRVVDEVLAALDIAPEDEL